MELELETGVRFCRKFTDKQLQVSLDMFIVCKAQQCFFWGVRIAIPAVRAWLIIIWRHETHAQDMRLGSSALNTAMDPGIDKWLLSVSKSRSCIWLFPCETLGDLRTFYVSALPITQGGEEAEYAASMWTSCMSSMMFITYVHMPNLWIIQATAHISNYSMRFARNLRTHKPWLVRLLSLTSCVGCLGSYRNSCTHPSVVRFHICHPPVMQCCTSVAIVVWYFDALHECDGTVQLQCLCAHLSCVCYLSACLCVCLYRVCLQSRQPGRFHIHWY